ncbi:MAG: RNA 3'-terminal phosphate cyclase [Myxococcota bacterium]
MNDPIDIDGAQGEGGGQILRTSLALSIITKTPVAFRNLRAKRAKPGLRRQHLAAVRAAAAICGATVRGDAIGSMELWFDPTAVQPGHHAVAIGTAGSTTLVLQTVLWPLLLADEPSEVVIEGGTHNPMAPTFEFLDRTFLPAVRRMGVDAALTLEQPGFYPAGGGRLRATLRPSTLVPATWTERGKARGVDARALVANLPANVGARELGTALKRLGWQRNVGKMLRLRADGPGNALLLGATFDSGTMVVSSIGSKGKRAEDVAIEAAEEMLRFLDAEVPVDEHLADQLLIPMALAGGGSFITTEPSMHTRTNADVIGRFLPATTAFSPVDGPRWRVDVTATPSAC